MTSSQDLSWEDVTDNPQMLQASAVMISLPGDTRSNQNPCHPEIGTDGGQQSGVQDVRAEMGYAQSHSVEACKAKARHKLPLAGASRLMFFCHPRLNVERMSLASHLHLETMRPLPSVGLGLMWSHALGVQDAGAEMKLVLARATKALAVSPANRVLLLDASVLEQLLAMIASPSRSLSRHATQVCCCLM